MDGAPTKLPTGSHISQMRLDIRTSARKRAFFNADHEEAYCNFQWTRLTHDSPWSPSDTHRPSGGRLCVRKPYSSALFNIIPGIPLIGYFYDFGAITPYAIPKEALYTIVEFLTKLGIYLKTRKAGVGRRIIFQLSIENGKK